MSKKEAVSVEESIEQAMGEIEENTTDEVLDDPVEEEPEETAEEPETPEEPEQKTPEEEPQEPSEEPKEELDPDDKPPQSWGGTVKDKWADIPKEAREEIRKRENDIHQMMTRHDGELNMGREMKEVITPYMPILQSVGASPKDAVKNLLNNDYVLRTGTPEQKAALVNNLLEYYRVDLGQIQQQNDMDPAIKQVMDRINGVEQTFQQQQTLQEKQQQDKLLEEIQAFSAKPENVHFEQVKAKMASLLDSGQAKDMQEAYEAACWADPQIRSTLIEAQNKEQQEKRKQEVEKKKKAAASVTGSPGTKPADSTKKTQHTSVEDDLAAAYDEIVSSKI